jgi:hypothetical protein
MGSRRNCNYIAAGVFELFAVKYFTNREISWAFDKPSRLSNHKFKSLFLYNVRDVRALWAKLDEGDMPFNHPEHLLWTLYYLKVYPTWDQMAMTTSISEKTLRKWIGIVINHLGAIDDLVRTVRFLLEQFTKVVRTSTTSTASFSKNKR